jgi:hypothetical protein
VVQVVEQAYASAKTAFEAEGVEGLVGGDG